MNITKNLIDLTAKTISSMLEEGKELGPNLTSSARCLYEKLTELLEQAPEVRGWELKEDPNKLFHDGPFGVKVGERLFSEKGAYFLWKNLLLTAVWGDEEIERGLAAVEGVKPLSNEKAREAWNEMNTKEDKNEDI